MNLIGHKFGRLEVIEFSHLGKWNKPVWKCLCSCGKIKNVAQASLRIGDSKSCGCLRNEMSGARGRDQLLTHGMTKTRTYNVWRSMHKRCNDPSHKSFKDYGMRGISICEEWYSFEAFLSDMGEVPTGLSIERIKNNEGYRKDNCKWATAKEQCNNRRSNVHVIFNGKRMCLADVARAYGKSTALMSLWAKRGRFIFA